VRYNAVTNTFAYRGGKIASAEIQNAGTLSARVHEINAQLAQQRNTFNLAE
jgi:hypothetical protein